MAGIAYFVIYGLALVTFAVIVGRQLHDSPFRHKHTLLLTLSYLAGMFYSAHGFYFILVESSLTNRGAARFWSWVGQQSGSFEPAAALQQLFDSGGGLWGGPFFVLLLSVSLLVATRLSLAMKQEVADACAVALPFSLALCKVGCFVAGCCHGFRGEGALFTTNTWGCTFLGSHQASCFPTQLVDLSNYLLIGVMLVLLGKRSTRHGDLLTWFVLLFSVLRFGTEFSRGDNVGPTALGLTLVQLVLCGSFVLSLLLALLPRVLEVVLSRFVPQDAEGLPEAAAEAASKRYVILVVISTITVLPLLFFPLVFGVFLIRDLISPAPSEQRQRSDLLHHGICFSLGLLWFTTFLVPSLLPFLVMLASSTVMLVAFFSWYHKSTVGQIPGDVAVSW